MNDLTTLLIGLLCSIAFGIVMGSWETAAATARERAGLDDWLQALATESELVVASNSGTRWTGTCAGRDLRLDYVSSSRTARSPQNPEPWDYLHVVVPCRHTTPFRADHDRDWSPFESKKIIRRALQMSRDQVSDAQLLSRLDQHIAEERYSGIKSEERGFRSRFVTNPDCSDRRQFSHLSLALRLERSPGSRVLGPELFASLQLLLDTADYLGAGLQESQQRAGSTMIRSPDVCLSR